MFFFEYGLKLSLIFVNDYDANVCDPEDVACPTTRVSPLNISDVSSCRQFPIHEEDSNDNVTQNKIIADPKQ